MKSNIMDKFKLILLSCALLFSGFTASFAEVLDKIAVIVNNEVITYGEIDGMLGPIYQQYRTMYSGDKLIAKLEEARQRIMQQLIEDRLILGEAKKQNIEVSEKEVDDRIDEMVKRIGSRENFERAILEEHISIRELRRRYKEQMMSRRLIDKKIGSQVTITPVETANYYNAHRDEFSRPEHIRLRNILIRVKEDPKKALALMNEIVRRLSEGCDFGALAKIYSEGPGAADGGLMDDVKRGELMPEIEKVVFNLKAGETSPVIQTSLGYHLFRLEEKQPARIRSYEEVRREVEEAVYREKVKDKIGGWVEGLKKNAYIAFK